MRDNRIRAAVAQLVERKLPKLEVAGSRPVRRLRSRALNLPASDNVTAVSEHTIARAETADLADLLVLMRAYCDFYEVAPTDEDLLALARALIADPEGEAMQFIAREDTGRASGFATLFWTWSTTNACRIGIMNDLYVAEPARGHGLADRLIETCRAQCARRGARRLTWQTAPDNHRAQAVYDRVGGNREQWVDYWLAS